MSKLLEYVNELLNQNQGDYGRLQHIKKTLEENKTVYVSDINYVTTMMKKITEDNTLKSDSNERTKHFEKLDKTSLSEKKNITVDKNGPIKVDDWDETSLCVKCGNKMKNEKFCSNCGTSTDGNENDIPTFAIVFGVLLIISASLVFFVPINDMGMSTLDVSNLCKGPIGMLGQAFGGERVVSACATANLSVSLGIIGFLIGLILIVYGFVKRK
jgi:hypothetical protein